MLQFSNDQGSFPNDASQFSISVKNLICQKLSLIKPVALKIFSLIHLTIVVHIYLLIFLSQPNSMIHHKKGSDTYKEVKALQTSLMVMSGSHNPIDIYELSWIQIFMHISCFNIYPLVVSSFLNYFRYFQIDHHNIQDTFYD